MRCILQFYAAKMTKLDTYSAIDETTGHSNEHSATEMERLSRYSILSHQAGMRFFSLES